MKVDEIVGKYLNEDSKQYDEIYKKINLTNNGNALLVNFDKKEKAIIDKMRKEGLLIRATIRQAGGGSLDAIRVNPKNKKGLATVHESSDNKNWMLWDFKDLGGGSVKATRKFKHIANIVPDNNKFVLVIRSKDKEWKQYNGKKFDSLESAENFLKYY